VPGKKSLPLKITCLINSKILNLLFDVKKKHFLRVATLKYEKEIFDALISEFSIFVI
jgi:hypothetical protein